MRLDNDKEAERHSRSREVEVEVETLILTIPEKQRLSPPHAPCNRPHTLLVIRYVSCKELRFIIYSIPILSIAAARGLAVIIHKAQTNR